MGYRKFSEIPLMQDVLHSLEFWAEDKGSVLLSPIVDNCNGYRERIGFGLDHTLPHIYADFSLEKFNGSEGLGVHVPVKAHFPEHIYGNSVVLSEQELVLGMMLTNSFRDWTNEICNCNQTTARRDASKLVRAVDPVKVALSLGKV